MPYSAAEGGGEKKSQQAHRGSRRRTGMPKQINSASGWLRAKTMYALAGNDDAHNARSGRSPWTG